MQWNNQRRELIDLARIRDAELTKLQLATNHKRHQSTDALEQNELNRLSGKCVQSTITNESANNVTKGDSRKHQIKRTAHRYLWLKVTRLSEKFMWAPSEPPKRLACCCTNLCSWSSRFCIRDKLSLLFLKVRKLYPLTNSMTSIRDKAQPACRAGRRTAGREWDP